MLGSAILKRWLVSLALVGLVSLFMASFAPEWVSPASAGTTTTAPAGQILSDLNLAGVNSLNLQAGQVVALSVDPVDDTGAVDQNMPNVTYVWSAGSCGSLSSTSIQSPVFTAGSSSCSGQVGVHAKQNSGSQVPASDLIISISVVAPSAPAAATPVPVDPTTIPVIVPDGLSADDVSVILPSTGGAFSVPQAEGDTAAPIAISIPGGAIDSGTASAVSIVVVSSDDVPVPPASATEGLTSNTFKFGSTIIDIQWYDDSGSALSSFSLNRPAEICVPFVQSDVDGAVGGPDGLSIWRYNGTQWVELNSSVNISDGTVCANTSSFSSFALGLAVAVDAVPVSVEPVRLPVTGDHTPGVSSLILAMLAGFGLIGIGVFTARRARRARQNV